MTDKEQNSEKDIDAEKLENKPQVLESKVALASYKRCLETGEEMIDPATGEPMSKRKLRKLKKTLKYEETKHIKRQHERQRKKERLQRLRENGVEIGPSRKSLKKNKMADSECKVRVAIDCSFDDYMSEKDVGDIVKQLCHSYAANRRAQNPLQFYVTSVEKKMKLKLDSQDDTKYWDVHLKTESYESIFKKEEIVYLSSDSDNVLDTLTEDKVYIIGGLVDHNHHKGLCHRLAVEKGLFHARLPIDEYIKLQSRKVLSINQVFEILVGYTETASWETAFLNALPKRKGAKSKCTEASANQHEDEDAEKSEALVASPKECTEEENKPQNLCNVTMNHQDSDDVDTVTENIPPEDSKRDVNIEHHVDCNIESDVDNNVCSACETSQNKGPT